MSRTPARARIVALTVPAAVAALLLPAAPAVAATVDYQLSTRCIDDFTGSYPASAATTVATTATELVLELPAIVTDLADSVDPDTVTIAYTGPAGNEYLFAVAATDERITYALPSDWIAADETRSVAIDGFIFGPNCPSDADTDFITNLRLNLDLVGTATGPDSAVIDLETAPGTSSAITLDGGADDGVRTDASWGDTIVIRGEAGYFLGGPEGRAAGDDVRAYLRAVPFNSGIDLADPIISADGSTATVVLPPADPDPESGIWQYAGLLVFQSGTGGSGGAGGTAVAVADLTMQQVVVTGTAPKLSAVPKLYRTVRAVPGAWGPAGVALSYQWLRDGRPIAGAVAPTYRPRLADLGHRLSVVVTGSAPGAAPLSLTSTPQRVRLL